MTGCARLDCDQPARWFPVVLLHAPIAYQDAPEIRCELHLPTCDGCHDRIALADVVTPAGLEHLANAVAGAGKVRPDLARTVLAWRPLED